MKHSLSLISISIVFFSYAINLLGQNSLDPRPLSMQLNNAGIYNTEFFKSNSQKKFVYGWNWGSEGRKLDEMLDINYYHSAVDPRTITEEEDPLTNKRIKRFTLKQSSELARELWGPKRMPDNNAAVSENYYRSGDLAAKWAINIHGITSGSGDLVILNAPAFVYFPKKNYCMTGPMENEKLGAVFGFSNVIGNIEGDWLKLEKSMTINLNNAVLSGVEPNDKYYTINNVNLYKSGEISEYEDLSGGSFRISANECNGTQNRLSINIRIDEAMPYDPTKENEVVLRLRIRYRDYKSHINNLPYKYIKFTKFTNGRLLDCPRGFFREMSHETLTENINITRKMLRISNTNNTNQIINLSAVFTHGYGTRVETINEEEVTVTDYNNPQPNPEFHFERYPNITYSRNDMIHDYDIEVFYNPVVDVSIRHIIMGSENASKLFWGKYDNWIQNAITTTENAFDNTEPDNNPYGTKIHRIYGNDEIKENYWASARYYNKLLNGIMTTEKSYKGNIIELKHCLELKEFWTGDHPQLGILNLAPYIRDADFTPNTFNYFGGYLGNLHYNMNTNKIYSDYETYYSSDEIKNPFTHINNFDQYGIVYQKDPINWINTQAPLVQFEKNYYDCYSNNQIMFDDNDFWTNIWVHDFWERRITENLNNNQTTNQQGYVQDANRPLSGEEASYIVNLPLLIGAKGMIIWWKYTNYWIQSNEDKETKIRTTTIQQSKGLFPYDMWYNNLENHQDIIDLDGPTLFRHPITGSDFLPNYNQEWYGIHPIKINEVSFSSTNNNDIMSIGNYINNGNYFPRFYTGYTSLNSVFYKNRKFINILENKIMKMKLVLYHYKGFLRNTTGKNSDELNYYLSLFDLNNIKTIPFYRIMNEPIVFQNNPKQLCENNIHNQDSGFYDITFLKYTDQPFDKKFVLGVANRRTSPLIFNVDDLSVLKSTSGFSSQDLKFFSLDEFERGCMLQDNSTLHGHDRNWWKEQYWRRQGARLMQIPVLNKPKPGKHLIVKVKELGIGTSLESEYWYRKENGLTSLVDTSLGFSESDVNSQNLSILLAPGETKMIELTYCYSDLSADLAYSNQHKIVAYPTEVVNGVPKKVRYHSTYYHFSGNKFEVFYRRSIETTPSTPFETIAWEEEIPLSNFVQYPDQLYDASLFESKYPSLVVRKKNNGEPFVYIVFEGKSLENPYIGGIFETSFEANTTNQSPQTPYCLDAYNSINYNNNWGKAVVSASANGNYYCWSTPGCEQIKAAWKEPDAISFQQNHSILLKYALNSNYCAHPSLNNYSRLTMGEDDCSIVWEEGSSNRTNIMYSRLKIDQFGNLVNNIPSQYFYPPSGVISDNQLGTACLSCVYTDGSPGFIDNESNITINEGAHKKPFILRELSENRLNIVAEKVYWEVYHVSPGDSVDIASRALYIDKQANSWYTYYPFRIYQQGFQLSQPNASSYTSTGNYSGTRNIINIISTPNRISPDNSNSRMWQIVESFYSMTPPGSNNENSSIYGLDKVTNWAKADQLQFPGQYPHISSFYPSLMNNQTNFIARIFQFGSPAPFVFSKKTDIVENHKCVVLAGFQDTLKNNFFVSNISLTDEDGYKMYLKFDNTLNNSVQKRDTLYSDWFNIKQSKLNFISSGNKSMLMNFFIQRKSDMKLFNVKTNSRGIRKLVKQKHNLINGKNHLYRIAVVKNHEKSYYTEELALGTDFDVQDLSDDSYFQKSNENSYEDMIDLGETEVKNALLVYPNPANDKVYLNLDNIKNGRIKVTTVIGKEVINLPIEDKVTHVIDVSILENGTYNIQIQYVDDDNYQKTINNQFIISR